MLISFCPFSGYFIHQISRTRCKDRDSHCQNAKSKFQKHSTFRRPKIEKISIEEESYHIHTILTSSKLSSYCPANSLAITSLRFRRWFLRLRWPTAPAESRHSPPELTNELLKSNVDPGMAKRFLALDFLRRTKSPPLLRLMLVIGGESRHKAGESSTGAPTTNEAPTATILKKQEFGSCNEESRRYPIKYKEEWEMGGGSKIHLPWETQTSENSIWNCTRKGWKKKKRKGLRFSEGRVRVRFIFLLHFSRFSFFQYTHSDCQRKP